jgi:hypothetical protein
MVGEGPLRKASSAQPCVLTFFPARWGCTRRSNMSPYAIRHLRLLNCSETSSGSGFFVLLRGRRRVSLWAVLCAIRR